MDEEDSVIDYTKQELLLAMYASSARMNNHIVENNSDGVIAEQGLQLNLRSNFRELEERQGIHSEL